LALKSNRAGDKKSLKKAIKLIRKTSNIFTLNYETNFLLPSVEAKARWARPSRGRIEVRRCFIFKINTSPYPLLI